MIFNTRGERPPAIEEFDESAYAPLGPADDVRRLLSGWLPEIDWADPSHGIYLADEFSIEFEVGNEDIVKWMTLLVRGGGDAISVIAHLARSFGWSALDCSTTEFLDPEAPSEAGFRGYQALCDKARDTWRKPQPET